MYILTHLAEWALTLWTRSFQYFNIRSVWLVFILTIFFIKVPFLNANSADPDQTLRFVASDLGLDCLPLSLLWDAKINWVKKFRVVTQSHPKPVTSTLAVTENIIKYKEAII